jgi:hypothetical protein
MVQPRNPNFRELRMAVLELGGEVISGRVAGKHFLVTVKTSKGNTIRFTLSKGPMRQGHILFWMRQKFNRADRDGHSRSDVKPKGTRK